MHSIEAVDQSGGCGQKFEIIVVSSIFQGKFDRTIQIEYYYLISSVDKAMVMQHRAVHKVIDDEMKVIHAVTLRTITPGDWPTHAENPENKTEA